MTTNLVTATPRQLATAMSEATLLGVRDEIEGRVARNGNAIVVALGFKEWRNFHASALKAAYTAGRSHVEVMGQ